MKWLEKIPRYRLLGLSRRDVIQVRNWIIRTYLGPHECLLMRPVRYQFGISQVRLTGGVTPCFEWDCRGLGVEPAHSKAWLMIIPGRDPSWGWSETFLRSENGPEISISDVLPIPFNDKKARVAANLVKAFSSYYPFVPTNNFFQNNGEFIA